MFTRAVKGGLLALLLLVALSACTAQIDRNEDGSIRVEATMPESEIQSEVARALEGRQLSDVTVDLQEGYAIVTGDYTGQGGRSGELRFRLDLAAVDGRLSASISELTVNGAPLSDERTAEWNQRIAERLERAAERRERATLESVSIAQDQVVMVWRVER